MVTPTFDISSHLDQSTTRRPRSGGESLRYRLDVVASSTSDVVQAAGGWLYDRVMAGWEVTVLLADSGDSRPLQILGVQAVDLETGYTGARSQSLAVSAEAFSANDCVRELVREALGRRMTEVALWGEGWPLGVNRGMTRTEYVLSAAARAFKTQALIAAGIPYPSIDPTEALLTA